jgi:hypothetical protein
MRLMALAVLVMMSACGPQLMTPDAGGGACSVPMKSPPNLARNGLFECGDATMEFQSDGAAGKVESTAGRTGKGLKFTVAAGLFNNQFSSKWKLAVTTAATYCATAYVKSPAPVITMRLYAANMTNQWKEFDLPGPAADWSRIPPTIVVNQNAQPGDDVFLMFVDESSTAGRVIEVDDLDVWVSADGRCQEAR